MDQNFRICHTFSCVDSGNITVSRGLNRGETKFVRKKDVIYRQFTTGIKLLCNL